MDRYEPDPTIYGEGAEGVLRPPKPQGEPIEQIKSSLSGAVRKAAGSLQRNIDQKGGQNEAVTHYGAQAVDLLERSADYIQDFEPGEVATQVRDEVRRNPGRSLLIAGAAGLVLGAIFRRR